LKHCILNIRHQIAPIATIIDGNSYIDNVPKANYSYEYYVKCYYNDEYLGQSNWYELQSSHRRKGGQEYIKYLYASHQMVVALEGWWVSELEIRWNILAGNYDETSDEIEAGGQHFQCKKEEYKNWFGNTKTRYVSPRLVSSHDDVNLFEWMKNDNYGSYTVYFRERDSNTNEEMWEVSVDCATKVVRYIWADNVLVQAIAEGGSEIIKKFIEVYKRDDEIGEVHVNWSTPNGYVHDNVNENGFKVIINQRN
jgi:hypothetical protein